MTATLPFPARYLAALGIALLIGGAVLVARPFLAGDSTATPAATPAPARTSPTPAPQPAVPKVKLLPNVPRTLAAKLQRKPVVVVAIYSGTSASDRAQVAVARKGARTGGAVSATYNILDEQSARDVAGFFGPVDVPAVAVVRRPGKVVTLLEGPVDAAIVEQAAHNAGARR